MKNNKISQKIKHILTTICKIFHYTFYQKYLLKTFSKDFLMWFFALFFVLFSLCYIDNSLLKLHTYDKTLYILSKSMIDFFNIFDVFILCVCLSFFIRSKNHFNFCILNSFSVKSFAILKPIFLFLFLIWLLKLFVIQPINANIYNRISNILKQTNEQKMLKYGDKINITDTTTDKMLIIFGKYKEKINDKILIDNAKILQYNNNNIEKIYHTNKLILMDEKWIIENALLIDNKYNTKKENYNKIITTKITIKNILTTLVSYVKTYTNQTTIYDIITYIINTSIDKVNNHFISNIISYIIELFNLYICCLITFLICISNNRNNNLIKQIIESFLGFFILVRVFHFFQNEMINSLFFCYCVLIFDFVLFVLFNIIIYEKDFNQKIIKKIRKETKNFNKKLTIKTIKTIRKRKKHKNLKQQNFFK